MAYYPTSFKHTTDPTTGLQKFEDERLQITYLNLRIVSNLIHDLQVAARTDILMVQNNVQVSAVKDQTASILGMFASKIFEGISVAFTAGTGAAIAAMVIGRIASAVVTQLVKESSPTDDIQKKANEVRTGMDAILNELKHRIDKMVVDLEGQWNKPFHCEGYLGEKYKGDVYLRDFADYDKLFPDQNSPDYDDISELLQKRNISVITSQLLGCKWSIKSLETYHFKDYYTTTSSVKKYDFDHQVYNPHTDEDYWCQKFNPIPGLGAWYEIESNEGHEHFMLWLKGLCSNGKNTYSYNRYSSYYSWAENFTETNGDRHYVGANIQQKHLVDSNGDYAPISLTEWLFLDDMYGQSFNKNGVATREDVYRNWNLPHY